MTSTSRHLIAAFALGLLSSGCVATKTTVPAAGAIPDDLRETFHLDRFYQKQITVSQMPIVGSANLSDFALRESAWIVARMCSGRDDILPTLAGNNVRLVTMAWNEFTTDLPEQRDMKPKVYWDRRARGLGGAPVVSAAEENVLCFPGDPYSAENILIHEFAHVIHGSAMKSLDPTFDSRLRASYNEAKKAGKWKGTYSITNHGEYWAEGAQSWFDDNRENDALHNHVNTRAELKDYDPGLAALCEEVFGDGPWRYKKPHLRRPADRVHLRGYDFTKSPRFRWRQAAITAKPEVSIETALGNIKVQLDAVRAPNTTRNFLRYALENFYSDGIFFRTVTASNQPGDKVKIAVIQAQADPKKEKDAFPPIKTERTRDTGLRHLDGSLSMAREGPDTETHHFVICIGDQPELDFGGNRNPDGQGFAVFGRVIEGMDLVRRIHQSAAEGQTLTPPIKIQRAIRVH